MTGGDCTEMQFLIQADLDGELGAADAARVAFHVAGCPACALLQTGLAALSATIKADAVRHAAPASLRRQWGAAGGRQTPAWARSAGALAVAACLAVALLRPASPDRLAEQIVAGQIVAGHIRALQPGHLMDIESTDQHNIKPWFDGRLDLAPPVRDLRQKGFPLAGARLDYAAGRPVAALVYRRRQHVIDLFVWVEPGGTARAGTQQGYHFLAWHADGMAFWAVSDLNERELADFARLLQAG